MKQVYGKVTEALARDKGSHFRTRVCLVLNHINHRASLMLTSAKLKILILRGCRRISQYIAQPPHLTVWDLWEGGGCCEQKDRRSSSTHASGWGRQQERRTWDAQKPSEMCPLKCPRARQGV